MEQTSEILAAPQSAQLMIDLEAQQDNLLRDLDELNHRIEQAIVAGQMGVRRADSIAVGTTPIR
jgi:hypothetical protein